MSNKRKSISQITNMTLKLQGADFKNNQTTKQLNKFI